MDVMLALIVGVLVLVAAVAGNTLSALMGTSFWSRLSSHRGRSSAAAALAVVAVVAAAVAGLISAPESPHRTSDRPSAVMWDAEGLRPGILYYDGFSPWADQPHFNAIVQASTKDGEPSRDERRFVTAAVLGRDTTWLTSLDVGVGDTLVVRVLVSNEAEPELNDVTDRRGIARGTRVALGYADTASRQPLLFGVVSADNAVPRWVAARLELRAAAPVRLRFVPGSARLLHDGEEVARLPDLAVVATTGQAGHIARAGSLVGRPGADGVLRAGWDQAIEVSAQFTVE